MIPKRLTLAFAVVGLLAVPSAGHPHPDTPHLREILDGLERGMVALEQLERRRELDVLRRVADDVRREMRNADGGGREREIAERQIEALRLALDVLRDEGRIEAIELGERAIHAREVALERRRDPEARDIRQRSPGRERIIDLMNLAQELYRRIGAEDRAEMVDRLTDELWSRGRDRQRGRADRERRERPGGRNEPIAHQIEIMQLAHHALLEADRRDGADLLEEAIAAREMDLHRRRDHEATTIRDRARALGAQIELLQMASALWREYGYPERAEAVGELAERLARRGSPRRRERGPRAEDLPRIEDLQERLSRLERSLEEARERLRSLQEQAP